ncbi:hypothetical protein [Psychromonas aquimarina]|uniref:hypothetical protein n=1 Tax=Psychromonas aquimarina TaxID=444919 RepID=UPI00048D67D4|nr:hypothetical protein [Psychromonas aquimarina]
MFNRIIKAIIAMFFSTTVQATETNIEFHNDDNVQKIAEAYSLDCVDFVRSKFNIELDWSDASILQIENTLESLSNYVKKSGMPSEQIDEFTKMFGFYIGEVYRKNHGGVVWGGVSIDGNKHFGMGKIDTGEAFIWPVLNVSKRISLGAEASITHYYSVITEK